MSQLLSELELSEIPNGSTYVRNSYRIDKSIFELYRRLNFTGHTHTRARANLDLLQTFTIPSTLYPCHEHNFQSTQTTRRSAI